MAASYLQFMSNCSFVGVGGLEHYKENLQFSHFLLLILTDFQPAFLSVCFLLLLRHTDKSSESGEYLRSHSPRSLTLKLWRPAQLHVKLPTVSIGLLSRTFCFYWRWTNTAGCWQMRREILATLFFFCWVFIPHSFCIVKLRFDRVVSLLLLSVCVLYRGQFPLLWV